MVNYFLAIRNNTGRLRYYLLAMHRNAINDIPILCMYLKR